MDLVLELPGDPDVVSPVVSRVMSLFENRLFEVQEGRAAKGRNDVLRQARIMKALSLHTDVPVPVVLLAGQLEVLPRAVVLPARAQEAAAEEQVAAADALRRHPQQRKTSFEPNRIFFT